jgi:uncharacterized membrane protein
MATRAGGQRSDAVEDAGEEALEPGGRGTERVEAFSDGVFAIAITLLVLEIRVPTAAQLASPDTLIRALGGLWPSYLGYTLSFVTIGIMWLNHHNLFRYIRTVDHTLLIANLFLLLVVGFVPFPTALLAATLGEPAEEIGVLVYAGTFVVMALGFNALWYAARRHGGTLLRPEASRAAIEAITRSYRFGPPGYLVAVIAALFNPALGMGVIVVLVLLYLLPGSSGG